MDRASSSGSLTTVSVPSTSKETFGMIPSNWSMYTQKCINEKLMEPKVRHDIVRTLATLIVAKHGPKPRSSEVEVVARQLVLKYPFMRDDLGTGYVSLILCVLVQYMRWMTCVHTGFLA